jgi:DNA-binding NarL/FixJ family response regulator
MGGKDAIKKLLEIDPNARAIVVSGYSNDPVMSRYQDYGFKGVIRKPFEIDELLDTLYTVVAAPS